MRKNNLDLMVDIRSNTYYNIIRRRERSEAEGTDKAARTGRVAGGKNRRVTSHDEAPRKDRPDSGSLPQHRPKDWNPEQNLKTGGAEISPAPRRGEIYENEICVSGYL